MSSGNSQISESSELLSNVQLDYETCPTCEQDIPPNKLEEIKGKIALKQREQALAITDRLSREYAIEAARSDEKAKAKLESERQESLAREARIREEPKKTTEKLIAEKLDEAERSRQELLTKSQQELAEAESAKKSAEQVQAKLQAELLETRQSNAAAIQAVKAEASQRELEIRAEEKRKAESAATERIAALEEAKLESEANTAAAEQEKTALRRQLDEERKAKESEIAKAKAEGTEAAELRLRDTISAQEEAVAEAQAKARQAEQQASEIERRLNTEREILEKAKQEAVNAEKARAFQETQKLLTQMSNMQRALEKKTADELGEGAEIDLLEALKAEFTDDKIDRIAKGAPGADIRHVVRLRGKECGTILYDSKNHKQFRAEHVTKLKADQLAAQAEHAILSLHKLPGDKRQIHVQDGIVLAYPARVVAIATILRQHLLQIHTLRLSEVQREAKTAALYEFITSEQCTNLLGRIDERANDLLKRQEKEITWHRNHWNKQGEAIRAIQRAKVDLEHEISSIIDREADDSEMLEVS